MEYYLPSSCVGGKQTLRVQQTRRTMVYTTDNKVSVTRTMKRRIGPARRSTQSPSQFFLSVRNLTTLLQMLLCLVLFVQGYTVQGVSTTERQRQHLRAGTISTNKNSDARTTTTSSTIQRQVESSSTNPTVVSTSVSAFDDPSQAHRKAIVGGTAARPNRFPSVVYLSDRENTLSCGGTLISPTVVLTAAHCEMSLLIDAVIARDNNHNNSQGNNSTQEKSNFVLDPNHDLSLDGPNTSPPAYQYERVRIKQELKHPLYDSNTLRYDIMLLQLDHAPTLQRSDNGTTTTTTNTPFPFMRLDIGDALDVIEYNSTTVLPLVQLDDSSDDVIVNRTIPNHDITRNDDILLALGWGHTQSSSSGLGQPSDKLQQAGLGLVSNQDCLEAHEGLWLSYEDRIFDEMMCTFSTTRDACYGDSGGPIILPGETPEEDVQVGIISWGEDCADPIFPGVATRVSFGYSWIRQWVCALDGDNDDIPDYFECDDSATFSPAPTLSPMVPTESSTPTIELVPIIINIHLDVFANELAWTLEDYDTEETVAQRPYGSYKYENEVSETVFVRPGHIYTFTALDLYGDGIANNGYYQIFASTGVDGDIANETMIVSATRFTGREQQRTFLAPDPTFRDDDIDQTTFQSSSHVLTSMPSGSPSAKASLEPSIVGPIEDSILDPSNDAGRLCIATGHFCRDSNSCCSLNCHSGFCLKDPASQKDQKIHPGAGGTGAGGTGSHQGT